MAYSVLTDIKQGATNHCYGSGDKALASKNALSQFKVVDAFLKDRQFIAGEYLTFADFQAVETIDLINFISDG